MQTWLSITSDGDKWYDEKESKHKGKSTAFYFSCALGKTGKHGDTWIITSSKNRREMQRYVCKCVPSRQNGKDSNKWHQNWTWAQLSLTWEPNYKHHVVINHSSSEDESWALFWKVSDVLALWYPASKGCWMVSFSFSLFFVLTVKGKQSSLLGNFSMEKEHGIDKL